MTRELYNQKLQDIKRLLQKGKLSAAKKAIDKLEKFKPVSLKLTVLLANYYLLIDNYEEVRKTLDDKWRPNFAYDGIPEALELYEQLWIRDPNERELLRNQFIKKLVLYIGTQTKEAEELEQEWNHLEALGESYYQTGEFFLLTELEQETYRRSEVLWNQMIQFYVRAIGKAELLPPGIEWVETLPNMGYLKERLEEPDAVFILTAEDDNIGMCSAIGRLLRELGKRVYLLEPPQERLEEQEAEQDAWVKISMKEAREDPCGIKRIPTYYAIDESGQQQDNRALFIAYFLEQELSEPFATILGSGGLLDDFSMEPCLKKIFSRFNFYQGDIFETNFSFGWAGDYRCYISRIYNYDVTELLQQDEEMYRYSIVIPARNSTESLRHTLKTCLELDYPKDTYEIVVSDNSTNNNMEIYQLCQELKDSRIHYYRTPRDLHLPKSFEYAFLQTKGAFILPIGSDDAILPWALKVLDDVQAKYPQEEIIQWERGFYAWPGFNGGQQHQFVIPRTYQQGAYQEGYRKGSDYLQQVLKNPEMMYGLPMLYINSGFKRSYMNTLLEKTGRLWDGVCQDVYIAVVNTLINDTILNLRYPLTIAGMTNGSVGATCVRTNADDARKTANVGGFSMSITERLMPEPSSDVSSLYNSLLRSVARGLVSEEYMWQNFNWKKMFSDCIQRLDIRDVEYDKLIHHARYAASWHGEDFLKWFDEEQYGKAMEPRLVDERAIRMQQKKKMYQEGETPEGGLVVDASKYGVTNSYEAMKLFVELSGLK